MSMIKRFPKFFATLTTVLDGDADQAAQILLEIEQSGIDHSEKDCVRIGGLFDWRETPQGFEWWGMMDDKAEQLLGADYRKADFEGCDCPACTTILKLGATSTAIGVVAGMGMLAAIFPFEAIEEIVKEAEQEEAAARKAKMH